MEDRKQKKLEQVRKLLDKASDPATPPAEAQALRQKADDLMLAYAISEFEVESLKPSHERRVPIRRHIKVCDRGNVIKTQLVDLMGTVVEHNRCKAVYSGLRDQRSGSVATVIGFESDIDYTEMLFTSLYVQMSRGLEPQPNPSLTFDENLIILKESGMKWERIHELLQPDVPWERRHGVRYTKIYTDYCAKHERHRMYTSPQRYQRNYAEAFVSEVHRRMYEIRQHQKQVGLSGTGMELAIIDQVGDAFNEAFGKAKGVVMAGRSKYDRQAHIQGTEAGARADLGQARVGPRGELL